MYELLSGVSGLLAVIAALASHLPTYALVLLGISVRFVRLVRWVRPINVLGARSLCTKHNGQNKRVKHTKRTT